ncbi:MAG: dephospho-CoA kinase [Zoogloeaceae bacterium]|jgi:dephospho-CoA kinase|nr:dephospho-CoA kinase [Zoogloeaceae bacterium]
MFVVGLTGGIGSGKSTVAALFARAGGGLVDTDEIAHRLTAPDGAALPHLTEAFGPGILDATGVLDRAALRRLAFSDPQARARLEGILHPMIRERAQTEIRAAATPYVLLAVPLLLETGGRNAYAIDRLLVVDCPEETQLTRVMARSALTRAEAQAILDAQIDRNTRRMAADDIIENQGTPEELEPIVNCLHQSYLAAARQKRTSAL